MSDLRHASRPAPGSLGKLVLLSHYNSYPSSRIRHFCTGQWYLLVMAELQRQRYIDRAEAWFVSDAPQTFVMHDVTVRCFASFAEMARAGDSTDILWVRGKCGPYVKVLNRLPARLRVYYPASKRFVAPEWNHFDVLLVDDARHVEPVQRLAGHSSVFRVIKTADPEIFRPLGGVEKRYDICMIGGMHITRKNYTALVKLLRADPSLSAAVIGKQVPDTVRELNDTGARITYFEFLGRDELNRVMNECRIGFVPSLFDAAPRVILEYIAAGVPVLLNAAILGGRDYITPQTGRVARASDFVGAARAMVEGPVRTDPRAGFEACFHPAQAARHLGDVLRAEIQRAGHGRAVAPPSLWRRLIRRPFMLQRKLARCWREIEAIPPMHG